MDRRITRRDFLEGSLVLATGIGAAQLSPVGALASSSVGYKKSTVNQSIYPPHDAGLRGSHRGSFEVAHQLAMEGRTNWGNVSEPDADEYDLIVVGAGISGLSAAYFYAEQHPNARILIIDNHDDFGGHAKRNEFNLSDRTILGYGGSQSLEAPSAYSDTAMDLLKKIGVDTEQLAAAYDRDFYKRHDLASSIYFDKQNYNKDNTIRTELFDPSLFLPLARAELSIKDSISSMPISDAAKSEILALINNSDDQLSDHSIFEEPNYLGTLSYQDLLTRHLGITETEILEMLRGATGSYFGHGIDTEPAILAIAFGLPGLGATSLGTFEGIIRKAISWTTEPYIYHFPDGNASVARLLVRKLIPSVADGSTMQDVVTANFDYQRLDNQENTTRIRLNSTVVQVNHVGRSDTAKTVDITYVRQGRSERIKAKQVILACYNMAVPHIFPELPDNQKVNLKKLVKTPLVYTNVLLNNWHAFKRLGIGMAYCPGSWHQLAMLDFPVSMGDYQFASNPDDPIVLHMNRTFLTDGLSPQEQSRAGRHELLNKPFETIEQEIRTHLNGMLAEGGFDAAKDIAAITVNRWSHGYAYRPNTLFDPNYEQGQTPFELGRKRFGRVSIANSDAGGRAYLDCAIDEGWRAVSELP